LFARIPLTALGGRLEPLLTGALMLAYLLLYSWLSVRRHQTYHSFGPDLALFDQVFWNTVHGRPFESTMSLSLTQPHSFFSDHFSPALWVLVPFYAALPRPETLLVLQTLALALGAVPVYLAARRHLPDGYQRLLWVAAYFLFVPLAHMNLYDFHEITLVIPLLGMALHLLDSGRVRWFWAFFAAALLVKEEVALIGLGIAAFMVLRRTHWRQGLLVAVVSVAWFAGVTSVVIPYFGHGRQYSYIAERYGALGTSTPDVLRTVLTRPFTVAHVLFQRQKIAFVVALFGPVLALNLISGWGALLVLPTLSYLLLSSYPPEFSISNQYPAPLLPLILVPAVWGFASLPARWRPAIGASVLASSLGFAFALGDLPGARKFDSRDFTTEPRYTAFAPELDRIPADASVAADNNLTPQLSQRRLVFDLEYESTNRAEYVALDYAAEKRDRSRFQRHLAAVEAQGYRPVAYGDGLALLVRSDVPPARRG
jgi:uncharacterized membrane protein